MSPSPTRRPCAGRFMLFSRLAAFLLLAATSRAVLSDDTPPAAPAKPSVLDRAPSERAKRDAEKVFHWIKIHADKPRKAATAVAVEKPAPAKVADRPAPKPADSGITETVEPIRPPMAKAARPAPAPAQPVSTPADNAVAAASAPAPRVAPPVPSGEAVASARLAAAAVEEEAEQEDLVPVLQSEPEFSASLMRRLRKGLVKVSFTVLPDGSVSQPQAVSSSHSRLEATALATVSKWRFQPVRQPQEAVVELGFDLD